MSDTAVVWLSIVLLAILFTNGESGTDLHTAIVTWLMGK